MPFRYFFALLLAATLSLHAFIADAQSSTQSSPESPPNGTVLFERSTPAVPVGTSPTPANPANPTTAAKDPTAVQPDPLAVTDAERTALTFTAYDLDLHLTPATAAISARAGLTVRNDSTASLARLVLQITSTLHWDAITSRATPVPFSMHEVDTDADHTGQMMEAVLTLPSPLAPGESLNLTAIYSGTIPPSAERLTRIGAPSNQALAADWDAIASPGSDGLSGGTALRGFGNVLWYPVSAPPVFLGDGAKLFQAVGAAKLKQSATSIRLRLAVEYVGDPPDAAFFCGRREQFTPISDNPNMPVAESPGVATALFAEQPLGFRTPSLFITAAAPTDTGTPGDSTLISAVTDHYDALPAYSAAAAQVEPLLTEWFGAQPLNPLTILDHTGQPFEDDTLLVRPMRAVEPASLTSSLVHSLTHAWISSSQPWIDEGLAQFASLLWTERSAGHSAVLAELQDATRTLALAEPEVPASESVSSSSSNTSEDAPTAAPSVSPAGVSLVAATGDVFYRTKAAAVWWMLRSLAGDEALKQSLQSYRLDAKLDRDPEGFEHTLERFSHKDLRWFFDDWVYRDRGLPDLSIVSVAPSQIQATSGLPAGWLVAVDIRNDGYAVADVPITVRSSNSTQTQRLRIPGRSSVSTRIIFPGNPQQVEVNDGTVPETQTSVHVRQLILPGH